MTRRVSRIKIGACGACALAAILIAHCARDTKPAERAAAAAAGARGGHVTPGAARAWPRGPDEERARAAALEERLAAAALVIAEPPPRPAPGAVLPPLPEPLPPEVEIERAMALEQWKRQVQEQLDTCAPRPAAGAREVALDVTFLPGPRAAGEPRQRLEARVIAVEPDTLRRLWEDLDPDLVQRCVDQVRGVPLEIALSGEALTHQFPNTAERVLVRL